MFFLIKLSIFFINLKIITSSYLNSELNHLKPLLERNNVVNKGVWMRHPRIKDISGEKGSFIFGANSLDVEGLVQSNFDAFGENGMEVSPDIYGYIERTKRASNYDGNDLLRENLKDCNGNEECKKSMEEKSYIKSKFVSKLKPASVFNDYPYEVAILLGGDKVEDVSKVRKTKESGDIVNVIPLDKNTDSNKVNLDSLVQTESSNNTINSSTPKRSMINEYENKVVKKIEITEDLIGDNFTKYDRGIFDRDEKVWHQNLPDTSYKVKPKYPKNKLINERGLLKVLSMLTKTFKKIMKQHSDIRKIHNRLHNINDEVSKNALGISKKYQDMADKYSYILSVSEKLKSLEENISLKEEYFKTKDMEMAKNLAEFESQQKKFLIQQKQFYNIQKLMLAQNEKINIKQNLIAKTQSEISHRQNNFARILKKAKQIYIDNKYATTFRPPTSFRPPTYQPANETEEISKITHTTTSAPLSTESVKINLFSIPALNKLVNQDLQILKEKDEQPVDDLVYKYYFNNTFIDNLIKNKILSSYVTTAENTAIARNAKSKRDGDELNTTILLPINSNKSGKESKLHRERRWIRHNHHSKAKLKKAGMKRNVLNPEINDGKPLTMDGTKLEGSTNDNSVTKLFAKNKSSPFLIMAKSFCNEIGQNANDQMLNWCVEKSLRRLQFIDSRMPTPFFSLVPEVPKIDKNNQTNQTIRPSPTNEGSKTTLLPTNSTVSPVTSVAPSTPLSTTPTVVPESTQTNPTFFPDNDELESNLKDFDLKPDTEGNVYYDGSLHASDLAGMMENADNSDGFSDIMPGLDSNSKVDVNPLTFNLQAKRRDLVRRINESLAKKQRG